MAWWLFQTCIENVHHYTAASYWTHPDNVGDVWKENASTPSRCHCLTNSPGHHGLSTPLASPTKVVFRKLGRSRQPWLSPITFFTRLEYNRQNLDSQQLLPSVSRCHFSSIITVGNPNYTKTFITLPDTQPPCLWIRQTYQNAAHVE